MKDLLKKVKSLQKTIDEQSKLLFQPIKDLIIEDDSIKTPEDWFAFKNGVLYARKNQRTREEAFADFRDRCPVFQILSDQGIEKLLLTNMLSKQLNQITKENIISPEAKNNLSLLYFKYEGLFLESVENYRLLLQLFVTKMPKSLSLQDMTTEFIEELKAIDVNAIRMFKDLYDNFDSKEVEQSISGYPNYESVELYVNDLLTLDQKLLIGKISVEAIESLPLHKQANHAYSYVESNIAIAQKFGLTETVQVNLMKHLPSMTKFSFYSISHIDEMILNLKYFEKNLEILKKIILDIHRS